MTIKQCCCSCGRELITEVGREYETYPYDGKTQTFYSKELRTITIEHKRDFHHPYGYVHQTWTGLLCEDCLDKTIGSVGKLTHWVD